MAEIVAKVLVLGGGPGGYVSAIRAGQLGLDVVLVEQGGLDGGLGGTCLNVGCIPSKAIIHAADAYAHATEQAKSAPFGLRVERPTIDFARTIEWKNGIVGRLTSGVGALLKRHRVKILQGHGVMVDGKTCRVETDTGPQVVSAEHVVLATGSLPAALPAAAVRRPRHLLDRGPVAADDSRTPGRGRRRLYRARARHRLRQARRQGHGDRGGKPHPARLRRGARAPGRPAPEDAGRRGADACPGRRPVRRGRCVADRAGRRGRAQHPGRPGARRYRQARQDHGLRPGTTRPHDERALRADRRALRDLDAQRLGGRRPHRRADAGPPRHGPGCRGRRADRRPSSRVRWLRDSLPFVSPIRRSSRSASRPTRRARRVTRCIPPCSRSRPTAGP